MMDHKVILITGSSRGIGAEAAKNFAAKGHRVIIHYHRSLKEAEKLLAEIEERAGKNRPCCAGRT